MMFKNDGRNSIFLALLVTIFSYFINNDEYFQQIAALTLRYIEPHKFFKEVSQVVIKLCNLYNKENK